MMKSILVVLIGMFALLIIASIVCFAIAGVQLADKDMNQLKDYVRNRFACTTGKTPFSPQSRKWLKRGVVLAVTGFLVHIGLIAVLAVVYFAR